jgi:hypothetical protein
MTKREWEALLTECCDIVLAFGPDILAGTWWLDPVYKRAVAIAWEVEASYRE